VGEHARPQIVEIEPSGLVWVKSSASSGGGGACVEVARTAGTVLVRDSRDRQGPRLVLPIASWRLLTGRL
jgi:Domain of unknown function (DUF397)